MYTCFTHFNSKFKTLTFERELNSLLHFNLLPQIQHMMAFKIVFTPIFVIIQVNI
jgi:hypothetical protein